MLIVIFILLVQLLSYQYNQFLNFGKIQWDCFRFNVTSNCFLLLDVLVNFMLSRVVYDNGFVCKNVYYFVQL